MLHETGNTRTVYVVQVDNKKDLSDAKKYGALRAVFANPRKPYETPDLLGRARHILSGWEPGDYLLMLGDPALCAVCMSVVAENHDVINLLSWDRNTFQYLPQRWDMDPIDDFVMAE